MRHNTSSEALGIVRDSGVSEDWLYKLEARTDETTH
jgi:hypothetical protein